MNNPNTPNKHSDRPSGIRNMLNNLLPGIVLLGAIGSATIPNEAEAGKVTRPTAAPLVPTTKATVKQAEVVKDPTPNRNPNPGRVNTPKITGLSEEQVKAQLEELRKQDAEKGDFTPGQASFGLSILALLTTIVAGWHFRGRIKEATDKFGKLEERMGEDEVYCDGEIDKAKECAGEAEQAVQEITDILAQKNS
jgi:hypothetical protein